jgi:2-phospho-L-lactate guanylyltransferase
MRILVPFAAREPKTRLATVLDDRERQVFARRMLADVLSAIRDCGHTTTVLSTAPIDIRANVLVDERPLTAAVNARLAEHAGESLAVVMADLPLVTAPTLERLFRPDVEVVLAPGRSGGTNAFVTRHPEFRVDYHGASIRDHRRIARELGASTTTIDSFRLATDVDETEDLVEVLLHGSGAAVDWLRDHGFELAIDEEERLDVERSVRW